MAGIRIEVTLPKEVFSDRKYIDAILRKMRTKTIPEIKGLFEQTTQGWKNSPSWSSKTWNTPSEIGSSVYPDGDNADQYSLVSLGSPPHPIKARSGGFLRFQHGSGYKSSTTPGILRSGPNSNSGAWVARPSVQHPGFEARSFPRLIKSEYGTTFSRDMQDAMNEAAKS